MACHVPVPGATVLNVQLWSVSGLSARSLIPLVSVAVYVVENDKSREGEKENDVGASHEIFPETGLLLPSTTLNVDVVTAAVLMASLKVTTILLSTAVQPEPAGGVVESTVGRTVSGANPVVNVHEWVAAMAFPNRSRA